MWYYFVSGVTVEDLFQYCKIYAKIASPAAVPAPELAHRQCFFAFILTRKKKLLVSPAAVDTAGGRKFYTTDLSPPKLIFFHCRTHYDKMVKECQVVNNICGGQLHILCNAYLRI